MVERLFLAVPRGCLQFVIVVFSDHTHLLFSKVDCAVISDNHSNMQRIPDDSSIFTAEAKTVDLALDFISTCDANNKFIIFSDSLSVLKAMHHTSSKNQQIQKLLEQCHVLLAYVRHPISSDNGIISQKLLLKSTFYYPLLVVMGVAYSCLKYGVLIIT